LLFNPSALHEEWNLTLVEGQNPVAEPPVVAQGMIFVTAGQGYDRSIFAINASTGRMQWHADFKNVWELSEPSYKNDMLYAQLIDQNESAMFLGYNINTGKAVFATQFGAQWNHYFAPTPYANDVYANGGEYGGVYSFAGNNGQKVWFNSLKSQGVCDSWTPAVASKYLAAYSYDGGESNGLVVVDRATGDAQSRITIPNSGGFYFANNAPILDDSKKLAFSMINGYLTAYDLTKATVQYSVNDGFIKPAQPVLVPENSIIYAETNNRVIAMNEHTGKTEWEWFAGIDVTLDGRYMLATKNAIFVSSNKGTFAIDRHTHETIWQTPLTGALAIEQSDSCINLYILERSDKSVILHQLRLTKS
jgi:outer membrane protein assembly factor BamB